MKNLWILFVCFVGFAFGQGQTFNKQDSLLGSNHALRAWWDVFDYALHVKPDYSTKTISGNNIIFYKTLTDSLPFKMQLDLQQPMKIDSAVFDGKMKIKFNQTNNFWMASLPYQEKNTQHSIQVFFSGKPKEAKNAPWDGGWVWKKDSLGNPWMSVACQGNGPSIWYPCKDLQSDEPDNGCSISITVPDTLVAIANGKLFRKSLSEKGLVTYQWQVKNPINNYNIVPYIGKYTLLHDSVTGEKGTLITDYWVLDYHVAKAKAHLKTSVVKTIKCFEYWFGPYPFYEDSYKIVEAPYLGMEHQSNVAYGNHYINGYLGRDLSNTGWGLKWDFIVVHESGHEWFGNNVTASDVADNWIHEGFTSYSEVLFTECEYGQEAGNDYAVGVRKSIANDVPIIGNYLVHHEGSGDMYNKGSQVVHMIRQIMNDDEKFRTLLRDINSAFYHKTVSSQELEAFISKKSGIDFKSLFDQYLRTVQIPKLECKLTKSKLSFRYANCVDSFSMPVKVVADKERWLHPTTQWQSINLDKAVQDISLDRNFYVEFVK